MGLNNYRWKLKVHYADMKFYRCRCLNIKKHAEGFGVKHCLRLEIYASELYEMFSYKHTETTCRRFRITRNFYKQLFYKQHQTETEKKKQAKVK